MPTAEEVLGIPPMPTAEQALGLPPQGGLLSDIRAGYGNKSLRELWTQESLPANVVKGVKRVAGGGSAFQHDPNAPGIKESLTALRDMAEEHPGIVLGSLVRSIVADPELLIPVGWEGLAGKSAVAAIDAARAAGYTAKGAATLGKVAGKATQVGQAAAIGTTVEAGRQFGEGKFSGSELGTAALESSPIGLLGKVGAHEGSPINEPPASSRFEGEPPLRPPPRKAGQVPAADDGILKLPRRTELSDLSDPEAGPQVPPGAERRAHRTPEHDEDATLMGEATGATPESVSLAAPDDPFNEEFRQSAAKERGPKTAGEAMSQLAGQIKSAAVAAGAGGALGYGVSTDKHKVRGAAIGAALGVLPLTKRVTGIDISAFGKTRNGELQAYARRAFQSMKWIEEMIPDKARREAISRHIDDPVTDNLADNEKLVVEHIRQFFDELGKAGLEEGVLKSLRDNYVPHIVGDDPALQSRAKAIFDELFGFNKGTGTGGARRFAKGRKHPTFAELNAALEDSGLKVKTTDISELVGIYSQSMFRAITDRRMVNAVKQTMMPDGTALVMSSDKAPDDYRLIESPHMNGMRVHPDIAEDMKFLLQARDPNAMTSKLSKLTVAAKRLSVSMSLFHAKTLLDGYIGAKGLGSVTIKSAVDSALKMYREGGNNDDLDALLKNGLMIGRPEDVGTRSLFQALGDTGKTADTLVNLPGIKQLGQLEHGLNQFTFGYLQSGMKIATSLMEMERLVGRGVSREDAARMAASYTNDIFGGLDWYRVATDTQSSVLRHMLMSAAGARGRPMMQLMMFAPDWTFATIRAAAKALPGFTEKEVGQMHRAYMLKSAMYYLIVANGINMWQTGHSVFQNKDPTRIELRDGRTMQFSKHFMEPMQWLRDPETTAENKSAFPGRLALDLHDRNQAEKMHRKPPPGSFENDVLQTLYPFSIKNMIENGFTAEDMLSTVGMPVYGKPKR